MENEEAIDLVHGNNNSASDSSDMDSSQPAESDTDLCQKIVVKIYLV